MTPLTTTPLVFALMGRGSFFFFRLVSGYALEADLCLYGLASPLKEWVAFRRLVSPLVGGQAEGGGAT
ncbi:hypothetical protein ES708_30067 [subsurface metagenome]